MEGLVGMEVYYGDYTIDQVKCLRSIADEIGLIPCGGSDYHASGNPGEPTPGSAGPSMDFLYKLKTNGQPLLNVQRQYICTINVSTQKFECRILEAVVDAVSRLLEAVRRGR